ncbi:hypothetical protein [Thalassospira sp. MCCC 1A03138]|uniref:hypothetical protein n=1 Tax=Thalassospira sp. MCCC 1A03138 TaxID=1470576 RepID=UPI000A1FE40B|nr:hypothetical protein [Thalassospira sp. MCCC 1A03138]OSQ29019.1 hypothetical protein TH468_15985 [Thalassospira sp. MCCC 1A03138]
MTGCIFARLSDRGGTMAGMGRAARAAASLGLVSGDGIGARGRYIRYAGPNFIRCGTAHLLVAIHARHVFRFSIKTNNRHLLRTHFASGEMGPVNDRCVANELVKGHRKNKGDTIVTIFREAVGAVA